MIGLETDIRLGCQVPRLLVSPTSNPHTPIAPMFTYILLGLVFVFSISAVSPRFQPSAPTASRSQMCTYRALISLVPLFSSSHNSLSLQLDTLSFKYLQLEFLKLSTPQKCPLNPATQSDHPSATTHPDSYDARSYCIMRPQRPKILPHRHHQHHNQC